MATTNGVFLLLVLPFFARIWFEAVVWRLQHGGQMLGFSLLHAGAGILTVPLILSFLAMYLYWLFVVVVLLMCLFPPLRREMRGIKFVVYGALSTVAFNVAATLMQFNLPDVVLYLGIFLLSVLFCALAWLAILSLRESQRVPV